MERLATCFVCSTNVWVGRLDRDSDKDLDYKLMLMLVGKRKWVCLWDCKSSSSNLFQRDNRLGTNNFQSSIDFKSFIYTSIDVARWFLLEGWKCAGAECPRCNNIHDSSVVSHAPFFCFPWLGFPAFLGLCASTSPPAVVLVFPRLVERVDASLFIFHDSSCYYWALYWQGWFHRRTGFWCFLVHIIIVVIITTASTERRGGG